MAVYWPTPDLKGRTFKTCVLTRWDFNFCVRSSPQQGPFPMPVSYIAISLIHPHVIKWGCLSLLPDVSHYSVMTINSWRAHVIHMKTSQSAGRIMRRWQSILLISRRVVTISVHVVHPSGHHSNYYWLPLGRKQDTHCCWKTSRIATQTNVVSFPAIVLLAISVSP